MPAKIEILQIRNLTMDMDVYSPSSGVCPEVIEHSDKNIVFEASASARVGQVLSIRAQLSGFPQSKQIKFEASGKIVAIEQSAGKTVRITMALDLFDKDKWRNFRDLADDDQSRCDRIFDSIRGTEE